MLREPPGEFKREWFFDTTDLADILNVSQESIYWWIKKGDLKAFKWKGRYYVTPDHFYWWLSKKEKRAENDYRRYSTAMKIYLAMDAGCSKNEVIKHYRTENL